MTILHVTNIGGVPTAILDNNNTVPMQDIAGSPRIGCTVAESDRGYEVVGNNVDESCVNNICPVR